MFISFFFFLNDQTTTEFYTLSLHDALPISRYFASGAGRDSRAALAPDGGGGRARSRAAGAGGDRARDRKSTRLNSSHGYISYAVFCLKKKNRTRLDFSVFCFYISIRIPFFL